MSSLSTARKEGPGTPTKEEGEATVKVTLDFDEVQGDCIPSDTEMYRTWMPKAVGIARGLRLDDPEGEAQDVLTDFILAGRHRRWDRTKGRQFDSFCYWMIRNRLLSKLRSQKRREAREGTPTDLLDLESTGASPVYMEHRFIDAEQHADLRSLAEFLESAHQQRDGLTPAAIVRALVDIDERVGQVDDVNGLASELGVTTTTLRYHKSVLRNLLAEHGEAEFLTSLLPA